MRIIFGPERLASKERSEDLKFFEEESQGKVRQASSMKELTVRRKRAEAGSFYHCSEKGTTCQLYSLSDYLRR